MLTEIPWLVLSLAESREANNEQRRAALHMKLIPTSEENTEVRGDSNTIQYLASVFLRCMACHDYVVVTGTDTSFA